MSAARTRRLRRRATKPLLCWVLAMLVVVSPLESGLLPAPVQDLAAARAGAQTPPSSVFEGSPEPCPSSPAAWTPEASDPDYMTASECVLELPACPESPLYPGTGTFMRLSVLPADVAAQFPSLPVPYSDVAGLESYPDFCEERVAQSSDSAAYAACVSTTGYVVNTFTDALSQPACRLLHPIACPEGLLDTSKTCRAVQRRTWTCPDNHVARNQFNSCYELQPEALDPHPACGPGSPDFGSPGVVIMLCEDYVGNDFFHSDADAVDCEATYTTNTPVQSGAAAVTMGPSMSNDHWCSYDARYLSVACHQTNLPAQCQTASPALCVKRSSRTGGCDGVARTIRCRAYEAAFRSDNATLEDTRLNGCRPCVILPFRRVPNRCPQDTRGTPRPGVSLGGGNFLENPDLAVILREEADFAITATECSTVRNGNESLANRADCAEHAVCADPPAGALSWEAAHIAGVAVTNAPVIVTVTDMTVRRRTRTLHQYNVGGDSADPPLTFASQYVVRYQRDASDDDRVRTFTGIDPSSTLTSIDEMPAGTDLSPGSECTVNQPPLFKLVVRELWPDNGPPFEAGDPECVVPIGQDRPGSDAEVILDLFGKDSLRWWCALSESERERRTFAKGLEWWDAPSTDQDRRVEELTEAADCDYTIDAETIWCRWVPSRSGFYQLHAGAAWQMTRYFDRVPAGPWLADLLDYLNDPADGPDRIAALQAELDSLRPRRRPERIGLNDSLTDAMLEPSTAPDWFYSSAAGKQVNCPSMDLRILCRGTVSGNYTKTEPIGIMVHEIRVSTVPPAG